MNYRIETKESFEVFGIEGIFRTDGGGEAPQTPAKLWEQSIANGEVKELEARAGDLPTFVSQELNPVHALCLQRRRQRHIWVYLGYYSGTHLGHLPIGAASVG